MDKNQLVKRMLGSDLWIWEEGQERMDWQCEKSVEWKRNVCGARKDDCAWQIESDEKVRGVYMYVCLVLAIILIASYIDS